MVEVLQDENVYTQSRTDAILCSVFYIWAFVAFIFLLNRIAKDFHFHIKNPFRLSGFFCNLLTLVQATLFVYSVVRLNTPRYLTIVFFVCRMVFVLVTSANQIITGRTLGQSFLRAWYLSIPLFLTLIAYLAADLACIIIVPVQNIDAAPFWLYVLGSVLCLTHLLLANMFAILPLVRRHPDHELDAFNCGTSLWHFTCFSVLLLAFIAAYVVSFVRSDVWYTISFISVEGILRVCCQFVYGAKAPKWAQKTLLLPLAKLFPVEMIFTPQVIEHEVTQDQEEMSICYDNQGGKHVMAKV
ncbi:unnamed protein product [Umbelopsis vinacea]